MFNKAINAYVADDKKNLGNLSKYAKEMRLYKKVAELMEVMLNGKIKNTRTPFSIDFGVGDVIVPKQEKRRIPTQLDGFVAPVINTYSIETTVAEKIDAILLLMEFSSRMKDYYDINYLSHKFDFEGKVLCEALSKTFNNRGHNFTIEQFKQIMTFDSDDGMQKKWKAFTKKIDVEVEEFPLILQRMNEFLWEPYTAVIKGTVYEKRWNANEGSWISTKNESFL